MSCTSLLQPTRTATAKFNDFSEPRTERGQRRRRVSPYQKGRGAALKPLFCGLMALGLILVFGVAGQGQGQPSYRFTTLDVPGSLRRARKFLH
jgi:hypothetical protein